MMKIFPYSRITGADNFKFKVSRLTLDVSAFEIHAHEFTELVIILGGTALHVTDTGHYPITAGDVFVINHTMSHGFEDCAGLRLCNIMYDPQQLLLTQSDIYQLSGYHALFVVEPLYRENHTLSNTLRLAIDELNRVDGIISKLIEEYTGKSAGYASMIHAYFMQLVVYLSRLHSSRTNDRSGSVSRLADALTLIETAFHQPLTLPMLADSAHLSVNQFMRLFKETFGLSPMQYVIRRRITRACQLLADHRLTISGVAQQVGFADSNYFSRMFKQVMGQSPQAYRKSHHNRFQLDEHIPGLSR